ncbi:Rha family transcriptional regulator [Nitratireductor sp. ac15]
MNEIVNITEGPALTMSSLEVAGLTGKKHFHVVRDIRKMLADLGQEETFHQNWMKVPSGNGRPLEVVNLPKRETLILVSGYSVQMRARIIDRWQELEQAIAIASSSNGIVTDLAKEVRGAIGGITKGIVHKELTEVIPALVRSELASQSLAFRRGKTAGQIWREAGFPRIRVTSWFSNRLCAMGCQIEGGGRGELGLGTAKLFDPDKADNWLRNGGRKLVEEYIASRRGQGKLKLVAGRAA